MESNTLGGAVRESIAKGMPVPVREGRVRSVKSPGLFLISIRSLMGDTRPLEVRGPEIDLEPGTVVWVARDEGGQLVLVSITGTSETGALAARVADLETRLAAVVGAPIPWLVSAIPDGHLEMNGQAIDPDDYPLLADIYGANLPDLRDKFLMGASGTHAVGTTGGEAAHTLTLGEIPSHSHGLSQIKFTAGGANTLRPLIDGMGSGVTQTTDPAGGGGSHNNLPPYRAVRWITVAG